MPHEDAAIAAEVAVWAQLHGSDAHGAVQLPLYVRGLLDRTIKARPAFTTTQAMPCCAVLDADNGLGLVASRRAIDAAIGICQANRTRRRRSAQQQPFRRRRLLCRPRRRAWADRHRLHQRHAGDRADRRHRGAARHQPDRRRVSAARRRSDHRRHGDQRWSRARASAMAGGRAKDDSRRLGARSERQADHRSRGRGERLGAADRRAEGLRARR